MLARQVRNREDAGSRGEDQEKDCADESPGRPARERPERDRQQRADDDCAGKNLRRLPRDRPSVIQAQPARPERQREVVEDHAQLTPGILKRRDARKAEPGRPPLRRDRLDDLPREDQPRHRQREIEAPSPPQRLPERTGEERPVVEQHRQRRGDHDFLASHSQRARQHRRRMPPFFATKTPRHQEERIPLPFLVAWCLGGKGRPNQARNLRG